MNKTNERAAPSPKNAASTTNDLNPTTPQSNQHVKTAPQSENQDPKRVRMMRQVSEDAPSKLGIFRSVYASTASPRQAIKAKCLECCWMDVVGIRECTATACPLWGFRPYQQKGGNHEA